MTDLLAVYGPHRESLTSAILADVLDALGQRHSALPAEVRPLKSGWKLFGRAVTLSCVAVAAEPHSPYAPRPEFERQFPPRTPQLVAPDGVVPAWIERGGSRSCATSRC